MAETTADLIEFPTATPDDTVRATVRALIGARRMTTNRLAPLVGMTDDTLRRKLNGVGEKNAMTCGDAARIAEFFRVPVADLFSGQVDLRPQPPNGVTVLERRPDRPFGLIPGGRDADAPARPISQPPLLLAVNT